MNIDRKNIPDCGEKPSRQFGLPEFETFEIGTYSQRILNDLRQAIIEGKFAPGQWLKESELASVMKVSKTPIREALRHLESEGLVEIVPHKMVRVKELSSKEIIDIYSVNALLESRATALSCQCQDPDYLEELETLHNELKETMLRNDFENFTIVNWRFHQVMISRSDNPKLLEINNSLRTLVMRYRYLSLRIPERMEKSFQEHEKILEAIRNKKSEIVERVVHDHIMTAGYALASEVGKKESLGPR